MAGLALFDSACQALQFVLSTMIVTTHFVTSRRVSYLAGGVSPTVVSWTEAVFHVP